MDGPCTVAEVDLSQPDLPFRSLEQRRAFEQILLQVEQGIMDGSIQAGGRLPPERELAALFGVSRASVREALRVLETFGVLVARRGSGPSAGSVISDGARMGLQSALRMHVGLLRIPTLDIVEVRSALEAEAARGAALRADPDEIGRLGHIVQRMSNTETAFEFNELDTDFHVQLASISHNALLPVLMEAIRGAIQEEMVKSFARLRDWKPTRDRLITEHEGIVRTIEEGNEAAAAQAVVNHISGFYTGVMDNARRRARLAT
jgi:GntR family transcriptional repressor for pyruvate dehydrogenase complex